MPTQLQTLLQLTVPVIVQVGEREMSLDDVLSMGPGAILELNKSAEDKLDLMVNNKSIGTGHVVKVGEHFGFRVSAIGTARQRIEAMGQ